MPKSGKGGSHWSAYSERRRTRDPEWRKMRPDGGPVTVNTEKKGKDNLAKAIQRLKERLTSGRRK